MHRLLVVAACLVGPAFAQPPTFEVASVKPQALVVGQPGSVGIWASGNTFHGEVQNLAGLVTYAYGVADFQVSGGPSWAYSGDLYGSDRYGVLAKAGGEAAPTQEQFGQMLQALLADRFQLKIHRETKEMPAYDLVVGKNGHKLRIATTDPKDQTSWTEPHRTDLYSGRKVSMTTLVWLLRLQAGRPVVDKTGLPGNYDFELQWSAGDPPPADAPAPSIFTAVQEQLGLKLESTRASFETIVIDRAERPSAN